MEPAHERVSPAPASGATVPLDMSVPQPVLDLSRNSGPGTFPLNSSFQHIPDLTSGQNIPENDVPTPLNLSTGLDLSLKETTPNDNQSKNDRKESQLEQCGTEAADKSPGLREDGHPEVEKKESAESKPAFAYTMTPVSAKPDVSASHVDNSNTPANQGSNTYPESHNSDPASQILHPKSRNADPVVQKQYTEGRNADPGIQKQNPEALNSDHEIRNQYPESHEMDVDDKRPLESHEEDEDCEDEDEDELESLQKLPEFAAMKKLDRHAITGRGVTLSMLMADGIIQPGPGTMSIDYLGQKFTADLLEDGSIRWKEANRIFSSPSAWAIHCKKIVNPMKKSGCGWASVRYKGKKLDAYKSSWLRKKRPQAMASMASGGGTEEEEEEAGDAKRIKQEDTTGEGVREGVDQQLALCLKEERRSSVKHATLGRKSITHNPKTLVECTPFASLGKVQPFSLSISTSALLVMDFHSHLSSSEVIGYLGGKWDPGSQHLSIERAFACCCRLHDKENAPKVEKEIRDEMESSGLVLAGWYHSHPHTQADPTLRDLEAQLLHQVAMKGSGESIQPCVAFIISPYSQDSLQREESDIRAMWLMAPPEHRSLDYGMPMRMCYDVTEDQGLPGYLLPEMKKQAAFHQGEPESVNFQDVWKHANTYLDKLKGSLSRKLPKDQQFDRDLLTFLNTLVN